MKKKYLLILPLLFGVVFAAATRTLNFETWTTLLSNQDLTITPSGTGVLNVDSDILMSGTGQIDLPVGTTAQRSGSPNSGMLRFNSETSSFEGYNGSAWGSIGGGGGGLDVFYDEDHESATDSSDYTTGLNATFDNGGTLGGALADETTNPIAGATSIKYTTSATATNSTNDWIASASITLDDKQKGNFVGFNFFYTWDGSDDLLCVIVWDDTNNAVLNDSTDCLETASNPTRYSLGVFIPTSTNAIKLGFHHTGASESSKVLVFDDLELSSNPFVYKDLNEIGSYKATDAVLYSSNNLAIPYLNTVTTDTSAKFGTVNNDATNGFYFRASRDVTVLAHGWISYTTTGSIGWTLNPTDTEKDTSIISGAIPEAKIMGLGYSSTTNTAYANAQAKVQMSAGDELYFHAQTGKSIHSVPGQQGVSLIFLAQAEHVVTPAKSGYQFISNVGAQNSIFTNFNQTNGLQLNEATATTNNSGLWETSTVSSKTRFTMLKKAIVSFDFSVFQASGGEMDFLVNGSAVLTSTDPVSNDTRANFSGSYVLNKGDYFEFDVVGNTLTNASNKASYSIFAQAAEAEFLAAVPVPLVAKITGEKASGTDGGDFTSGAWQTRELTNTYGDTSFVSLSSNQFTLPKGKYIIEASAVAYRVRTHRTAIYNVTDSAYEAYGTTERTGNGDTTGNSSFVEAVINISTTKTFELRHRAEFTKGGDGFGIAASFGVNEVYSTVKITKLK